MVEAPVDCLLPYVVCVFLFEPGSGGQYMQATECDSLNEVGSQDSRPVQEPKRLSVGLRSAVVACAVFGPPTDVSVHVKMSCRNQASTACTDAAAAAATACMVMGAFRLPKLLLGKACWTSTACTVAAAAQLHLHLVSVWAGGAALSLQRSETAAAGCLVVCAIQLATICCGMRHYLP